MLHNVVDAVRLQVSECCLQSTYSLLSPADICVKRFADYSTIDISEIFPTPFKEVVVEKTEKELLLEEQLREQKKRDKYRKILDKFIASQNKKHRFPSKMSSYDRMIVHDIATTLELWHYSEGALDKRYIVVSKTLRPETKEVNSEQCSETVSEPTIVPDVADYATEIPGAVSNNAKSIVTVVKESATKHCTLCGKNILKDNFTIHRLACEKIENEAIVLQKQKMAAKKLKSEIANKGEKNHQPTKKKSKPQKSASKQDEEEDDFDAIVSSYSASHLRCNYSECRNVTQKYALQACSWCHTSFCLQHHLAEAHGCGRHAKEHARAVSPARAKLEKNLWSSFTRERGELQFDSNIFFLLDKFYKKISLEWRDKTNFCVMLERCELYCLMLSNVYL